MAARSRCRRAVHLSTAAFSCTQGSLGFRRRYVATPPTSASTTTPKRIGSQGTDGAAAAGALAAADGAARIQAIVKTSPSLTAIGFSTKPPSVVDAASTKV